MIIKEKFKFLKLVHPDSSSSKWIIIELCFPQENKISFEEFMLELVHALHLIDEQNQYKMTFIINKSHSYFVPHKQMKKDKHETRNITKLWDQFKHFKRPIFALVDNIVNDSGLELILNCDLVFATQKSSFTWADPIYVNKLHQRIGIKKFVRHFGESNSLYYFLSGDSIQTDQALKAGIIQKVILSSEFDQLLNSWPNEIISRFPQSQILKLKRQLNEVQSHLFDKKNVGLSSPLLLKFDDITSDQSMHLLTDIEEHLSGL